MRLGRRGTIVKLWASRAGGGDGSICFGGGRPGFGSGDVSLARHGETVSKQARLIEFVGSAAD